MKLNAVLKDIDYPSLISFLGESAGRIFGMLRFGNLNPIAVKAINAGERAIVRKLESLCAERGIRVEIYALHAESLGSDCIRVSAEVGNIDFSSVVDLVIPEFRKKLSEDERLGFLSETMAAHPEAFTSCVSSFFGCLSREETDALTVSAINAFGPEIAQAIEKAAGKKGLHFSVAEIHAE